MDFQRANPAAVQRDFVDFPMNSSIHLVCSKGLIAGGCNICFEKLLSYCIWLVLYKRFNHGFPVCLWRNI